MERLSGKSRMDEERQLRSVQPVAAVTAIIAGATAICGGGGCAAGLQVPRRGRWPAVGARDLQHRKIGVAVRYTAAVIECDEKRPLAAKVEIRTQAIGGQVILRSYGARAGTRRGVCGRRRLPDSRHARGSCSGYAGADGGTEDFAAGSGGMVRRRDQGGEGAGRLAAAGAPERGREDSAIP